LRNKDLLITYFKINQLEWVHGWQGASLYEEPSFAHALALDAVLVTNDHAFARIKKLEVVDWTKEARQ
jgi:hypothetical protein